jgi:hypothetical protein
LGSGDGFPPVGISSNIHRGLERFFSGLAEFPMKILSRKASIFTMLLILKGFSSSGAWTAELRYAKFLGQGARFYRRMR